MTAIITFHFDGPIAKNHQISVRTLSRTLDHLQGSIDRAYLDVTYGRVWKNARLKYDEYQKTDFIVGTARDGGYILDLVSHTAANLVTRISQSIRSVQESPAFGDDLTETQRLVDQSVFKRNQARSALSFEKYLTTDKPELTQKYGNRSIAKEIDRILPPIRSKEGTNTFDLTFSTEDFTKQYSFDKESATSFHHIVSQRTLGDPLLVKGYLRQLDVGTANSPPKARIVNVDTKRDQLLMIGSEEDYNKLIPFLEKKRGAQKRIIFLASPVHEFNSYEPYGGDLYFLGEVDLDS